MAHRMKVGRFAAAARNALDSSREKGFASVSSTDGGSTRVATFSLMIRRRWAIFRARERIRWTFTTCDGACPSSSMAAYIISRCSGASLSRRCFPTPEIVSASAPMTLAEYVDSIQDPHLIMDMLVGAQQVAIGLPPARLLDPPRGSARRL
ncbi:hypothetical protein ACFXPI_12940 [Streptomyces sp. NPDC059104]|uniref:hypothetical protein n=1 Tax=Streptomyces sp. NPDC059104 TaxID=3346729 RepID=UPI0036833CB9